MKKEDKIKRSLGVAVKILEDVAEKLGDLQKEHEKAQPDLPDNTLSNAPVLCGIDNNKRYYAGIGSAFNNGRTASTGDPEFITDWPTGLIIDRNHGPDNHWLPWDGKDELPPYVKDRDFMCVKYDDGTYGVYHAENISWERVEQYLWLERDSDE